MVFAVFCDLIWSWFEFRCVSLQILASQNWQKIVERMMGKDLKRYSLELSWYCTAVWLLALDFPLYFLLLRVVFFFSYPPSPPTDPLCSMAAASVWMRCVCASVCWCHRAADWFTYRCGLHSYIGLLCKSQV